MRLPPPQHLTMLGCIFMPKDRNFITLIKSVSGETEIHVLVYSKQQSVDLLGYIQFISVNPKREFGAQPQQCSTCALTCKLFVFYLVFCKGFKRCRVHKVNILLIVVGMIHKLTSYSDSFTQLFPYKMHLHIDVENAYTKKANCHHLSTDHPGQSVQQSPLLLHLYSCNTCWVFLLTPLVCTVRI